MILLLALVGVPPGAGCAGEPAARRGVVGLDQLPAEYRALWLAWRQQAADWPARRATALADERMTAFLVDNLARELLGAYSRSELGALGSLHSGTFERARSELIILGPAAVPTLMELHAIGDGATGHLTGEILQQVGRPALGSALGLLTREEAQARRRGAALLGRLPHGLEQEAALRAGLEAAGRDDADWLVRRTALTSLAWRGTRDIRTEPTRRALSRALGDPEPEVRAAAVGGLAVLGDRNALPALINHLQRSELAADLAGYRATQEALQSLSGLQGKRDPAAWRSWWSSQPREPKKAP